MDSKRLGRLYRQRLPVYNRAKNHLRARIGEMVEDFAADHLFRVASLEARVKEFDSFNKKVVDRQIEDEEEALERIQDIVGVRIVTNNISDVQRIFEGIKDLGTISYEEGSLQDFLNSPQDSGYRALHLTVSCVVDYKGVQHKVACEVQIRTLFQDVWGILTHEDIYKNDQDLPPVILKLSRRLADQLRVLDDIAQDIRDAICEEVGSTELPPDSPVTKEGLAFLYHQQSGRHLLDFEIQQWMNALEEEGFGTIGEAEDYIPSPDIQRKMREIYGTVWGYEDVVEEEADHTHWDTPRLPLGMMLYYGTKIMSGDAQGYRKLRRAVESEYEDVVGVVRTEILAELPETVEELIRLLKNGNLGPDDLAPILRELGGIGECDMCGEEVLSCEDAHEALDSHYDSDKPEILDLLYDLAFSLPIDTVDERMSGLCHHCAHLLTSDHT
jgi:ppGpp synthetase/RelA/SpoT-type nucleotidyltranferase